MRQSPELDTKKRVGQEKIMEQLEGRIEKNGDIVQYGRPGMIPVLKDQFLLL